MMDAVVVSRFGGPEVLRVAQRPVPDISPSQVLIRVHAAGVNRPDIWQRKGKYPAPEGVAADILGLEVAGEVCAVKNPDSRWKVGDRVCALLAGAGYASNVAVESAHCMPIPHNMSYVEAACIPETVFTVWHNVFQRGNLQQGDVLLVHGGSGGIGTTAIQLGKLFGARVLTSAGNEEKREHCLRVGADRCINYKNEDFLSVYSDEQVNIILDSIGGEYFSKNMELLADDGRLVYINAVKGKNVTIDLLQLMKKRIVLTGSTLRSRSNAFKAELCHEIEHHVLPLMASRSFVPTVYATFPYDKAHIAHQMMEDGQFFGKLVLKFTADNGL